MRTPFGVAPSLGASLTDHTRRAREAIAREAVKGHQDAILYLRDCAEWLEPYITAPRSSRRSDAEIIAAAKLFLGESAPATGAHSSTSKKPAADIAASWKTAFAAARG